MSRIAILFLIFLCLPAPAEAQLIADWRAEPSTFLREARQENYTVVQTTDSTITVVSADREEKVESRFKGTGDFFSGLWRQDLTWMYDSPRSAEASLRKLLEVLSQKGEPHSIAGNQRTLSGYRIENAFWRPQRSGRYLEITVLPVFDIPH